MKSFEKALLSFILSLVLVTTIYGRNIKAASGTKLLVYNSTLNTSFDIEIDISATYSGTKWKGVSSIEASIDSNSLFYSYKITNNTLKCSVSSSNIKLTGGFTINKYYSIFGYGLVSAGSQEYSVTKNFAASTYLK